jgi:hypothetical protein
MMGFPENHTAIELAASGMPLSLRQQNGSAGKSLSIISEQAEATPIGLSLGDGLSYADWEAVGFELAKVGKAMQWWIGDWVNYGGKRYGETYKAAIEATGMSYSTVQKFALICNEFEMQRRRCILSFNHHVEVRSLPLDQQDELLDQAEAGRLSCAKMREIVRSKNCGQNITTEATIEDWATRCVNAFCNCNDRLPTLKLILAELQPCEVAALRDWIGQID